MCVANEPYIRYKRRAGTVGRARVEIARVIFARNVCASDRAL